jgi:hypothetical protein
MPMRKRTAVVTEAVCCFSPLFLGKNWSKFSLFTRNEALLLSYSRERDANDSSRQRNRDRNVYATF